MADNMIPTKGNLILVKKSLSLSKTGYELMNKKRTILIRELMDLIDEAAGIQSEIDVTFTEAYKALQKANIELGSSRIHEIANTVPVEEGIRIKVRSVMGTEIPLTRLESAPLDLAYAFCSTGVSLDEARLCFERVKLLAVKLAAAETSAYRLAGGIKRTQKRANALKNITIPRFERIKKSITAFLEEKDREEFTRLKVIKRTRKGA